MFRPITPPDWDLDRLKLEDADQLGYGGILRYVYTRYPEASKIRDAGTPA